MGKTPSQPKRKHVLRNFIWTVSASKTDGMPK
jgi:hypothetical protein